MAKWRINNVRMAGVAACVPENVVRTEDFSFMTAEEAGVFNNTVGIRRRHIADDGVCASDMCQKAAEKLIGELGWKRDSIDVLIFESVTGDYKTPPTSCLLQDRLGLSDTTFFQPTATPHVLIWSRFVMGHDVRNLWPHGNSRNAIYLR